VSNDTKTNALDVYAPQSMDQAMTLAKTLSKSGLLPQGLNSTEAVFTVMVAGHELGLSPMQSIRSIHIIKGKPTLSADLMVALVKRSPECEFFRLVSSDANAAVYETQRRGEPQPTPMTFDSSDAKRAGLTGGNWRSYPAAMLRARCSSALARAVYPDVVGGIYSEDERDLVDGQGAEPRDVTPKGPTIRTADAPVAPPEEVVPVARFATSDEVAEAKGSVKMSDGSRIQYDESGSPDALRGSDEEPPHPADDGHSEVVVDEQPADTTPFGMLSARITNAQTRAEATDVGPSIREALRDGFIDEEQRNELRAQYKTRMDDLS
jgi:hypothetical protein